MPYNLRKRKHTITNKSKKRQKKDDENNDDENNSNYNSGNKDFSINEYDSNYISDTDSNYSDTDSNYSTISSNTPEDFSEDFHSESEENSEGSLNDFIVNDSEENSEGDLVSDSDADGDEDSDADFDPSTYLKMMENEDIEEDTEDSSGVIEKLQDIIKLNIIGSIIKDNLYGNHIGLCNKDHKELKEARIINDLKDINVQKIMKSDLKVEDKAYLLEQYLILMNTSPFSDYYYRKRDHINDILDHRVDPPGEIIKINNELKKLTPPNDDKVQKILAKKWKPEIKRLLLNEYRSLLTMNSTDSEYYKLKKWFEFCIEFSDTKKNYSVNSLSTKVQKTLFALLVKKKFDEKLSGRNEVKNHIIDIIFNHINNPDARGSVLMLVGPPGVGKTSLLNSLAEVLELPFFSIKMGGIHDASVLKGHSRTYIGSIPGKIAEFMHDAGCNNPVIFLDEVDKISDRHGKEISGVMTHALDKEQNKNFEDEYVGFGIDLSNVLWTSACNDITRVNSIVRDRMEVIYLDGYNTQEKCNIAKEHLIPKALKESGFNKEDLIWNNEQIVHLIKISNIKEDGVRQLERNIQCIIRRINVLRSVNPDDVQLEYNVDVSLQPLVMTNHIIDKLFYESTEKNKVDMSMLYI